ncbi:MAG: hypothetical protein HQL20_07005 [Candidatus Omnitrophica bacterium]|nr:hypothetical protein [Candidatus Omnitrophota bacterium]
MSEHTPEAAEDKVKNVHLVDIPTKVTGVEDVEISARALKRLQKAPRRHHQVLESTPKHNKKKISAVVSPVKAQKVKGFMSLVFYAAGRLISAISNLIK